MSSYGDETPDWPTQATDAIVGFVDDVKYKTTRPATLAVRGVVYGIVILALAIPAVILLIIGVINVLAYLVEETTPLGVWLVYLVLGLIFTIAGLVLWGKRTE